MNREDLVRYAGAEGGTEEQAQRYLEAEERQRVRLSGEVVGGAAYVSLSHWGLWCWWAPFGFEEPVNPGLPYYGKPIGSQWAYWP